MASRPSGNPVRALVTRPREEARALAQALAERAVAALIEPMMEIEFADAAVDLADVQAVLCTSANGVRALARNTTFRSVPLFAVGEATAARARAEGFGIVESAAGDVADLVRVVAARLDPQAGPLIHVCGREVAGDIIAALRERGFAVERRVLYQARAVAALSAPAGHALAAGELDLALFFSPRTAAIFAGLVEQAGLLPACARIAALSISPAADRAVATIRWVERRVAARPDQAAILGTLDDFLAERRRG